MVLDGLLNGQIGHLRHVLQLVEMDRQQAYQPIVIGTLQGEIDLLVMQ
jgi:hypothetical protein